MRAQGVPHCSAAFPSCKSVCKKICFRDRRRVPVGNSMPTDKFFKYLPQKRRLHSLHPQRSRLGGSFFTFFFPGNLGNIQMINFIRRNKRLDVRANHFSRSIAVRQNNNPVFRQSSKQGPFFPIIEHTKSLGSQNRGVDYRRKFDLIIFALYHNWQRNRNFIHALPLLSF